MREKVTALKLQEVEEKLKEAQSQLKFYRGKEMKESGQQTEKKMMLECEVQVNSEMTMNHKNSQSLGGNVPPYMELNMRIL